MEGGKCGRDGVKGGKVWRRWCPPLLLFLYDSLQATVPILTSRATRALSLSLARSLAGSLSLAPSRSPLPLSLSLALSLSRSLSLSSPSVSLSLRLCVSVCARACLCLSVSVSVSPLSVPVSVSVSVPLTHTPSPPPPHPNYHRPGRTTSPLVWRDPPFGVSCDGPLCLQKTKTQLLDQTAYVMPINNRHYDTRQIFFQSSQI